MFLQIFYILGALQGLRNMPFLCLHAFLINLLHSKYPMLLALTNLLRSKYHPCHAKGLCEASRSLALQIEDAYASLRHGLQIFDLYGMVT